MGSECLNMRCGLSGFDLPNFQAASGGEKRGWRENRGKQKKHDDIKL